LQATRHVQLATAILNAIQASAKILQSA
jgi:hypothetical protein